MNINSWLKLHKIKILKKNLHCKFKILKINLVQNFFFLCFYVIN